jgi:dihydroorotase
VAPCVRCVDENRDVLVGVKIRLSDSIADEGRNESEAYNRALAAARQLRLPLMVHHSFSTVSMDDCPGKMAAGDIYTHAYHGFPSCILQPENRQLEWAVVEARRRGVLFDIGHGAGAFCWTVAELAAEAGFWPDTISSDLHQGTCEGPAYDLPTVMTRLLHVGMPLVEVIRAATVSPASAIGWQDRLGTLGIGRVADVAVLTMADVDMQLEDTNAQLRRVRQRLVPAAVWRAGRPGRVTAPRTFPNVAAIAARRSWWSRLVVHDDKLPA